MLNATVTVKKIWRGVYNLETMTDCVQIISLFLNEVHNKFIIGVIPDFLLP
jgi:hypothetical protein